MFSKGKVAGSLVWSIISKISRQLLQLGVIFILSRVLTPADFGLMSMVTAFSMLAEIVRNMGMGAAVIQQKVETPELLDTAFCFNLIVGLGVFLVFFLVAPLIADFYAQPELVSLVRVFSLVYIIGSVNIVQEALMQKRMEFKRLFVMDLVSVVVSGGIAIYMATHGYGVWSLVIQYITMVTVSSIILWITSSWKPALRFHLDTFNNLRRYSFNLFIHDVIYFFGRDTDKFLIGKYLGPVVLGVYYRAFMLMLLPVNQINAVITKVMFPVFSALQGNKEKMKRVYLKSAHLISFVSFPALSLLFIVAEPLVVLLLGEKWLDTAFYLKIFCLYGMLESVGTTIYWIYKSLGKTDLLLRWGVISTLCIIPALVFGLWWKGAAGVAYSYVIVQLVVLWVPGWTKAFRLIDLSFKEMLQSIGPNFLNALLAMAPAFIFFLWMKTFTPGLALVISTSVVYALSYLCLAAVTRQTGFLFLKGFLKRKLAH